MENDYQWWFVVDSYKVSGRPKLESALMDYAAKVFMNCLIIERELRYMAPHKYSSIKSATSTYGLEWNRKYRIESNREERTVKVTRVS